MRNRALFAAAVYLSVGTAHAHITLMDPAPRHSAQKSGPCGAGASDERGAVISTYAPGSTITVRWEETVPHPGYFRISFDADGQDDFFVPPTATPSGGDGVLVDAIADKEGTGLYEQQVTLPDTPCDRCTLQLVQVMTDKPPYGDGNDLYFQCADIVLSDDEPATTGATAGDDRLADGCGCNAPATSPLALLVLALRRQKRNVTPT